VTTCGTSSLFVHVTVVPGGMVMFAGPKLKLSILTVAPLAGLSPGLIARLGLVPFVQAKAVTTTAANPNIHLVLFIEVLL
jgi:hypothetical protein